MSRFPRLAVLLAAAALLIAAAPAASPASNADGPTASAAKTCSVGDYMGYGTTYVRWIRASNVGCKRARRVVRAFHACRPGKKGRCGRVSGFNCSENRFNKSRYQYDSNVTCRDGGKRVKHGYTQNT
jgi:hypothetical protein